MSLHLQMQVRYGLQVMKHIHYEDENTRYVDIGPVNKVINMLCCWFEDPDSLAFKK